MRQAYDENKLGVKNNTKAMKEEMQKAFFKHAKELVTQACEYFKSNPVYHKYSGPICEALQKIINDASGSGGSGASPAPGASPGPGAGGQKPSSSPAGPPGAAGGAQTPPPPSPSGGWR